MEKKFKHLLAVRDGHRKILTRHLCHAEGDDVTTDELTILIDKIGKKFTTLTELDENILSQTETDNVEEEMLQTEEIMLDAELRLKNLRMKLQKAETDKNTNGHAILVSKVDALPAIPATDNSPTMLQAAGAPIPEVLASSSEVSNLLAATDTLEQKFYDVFMSSEEYAEEKTENEESIQEAVNELENIVLEKGFVGLKEHLHENAEKWKKIPINIAITGSSGAGKSSFVNAFLGLNVNKENAAKTGATETTTDIKVYFNAERPNLKLWDMPGVGTPEHPKETYLEEVKFDQYDFFLILSERRFTSDDLWLAKEVQNRQKKFYFIRTCIDQDVANDIRVYKERHNAEELFKTVRDNIRKNLVSAEIEDPMIFLVDNLDPNAYEFQEVDQQLLRDCDDVKKEALILSLSNLTARSFKKKKEVLKERSKKQAMAIACVYSNTIREERFNEEIEFQAEQFGLSQKLLSESKDILQISEENIQKCNRTWEKVRMAWRLKSPRITLLSVYARIIRRFLMKFKADEKDFNEPTFKFCLLAFEQNIDEMFKMAMEMYGKTAQETLLKTSVFKKKECIP